MRVCILWCRAGGEFSSSVPRVIPRATQGCSPTPNLPKGLLPAGISEIGKLSREPSAPTWSGPQTTMSSVKATQLRPAMVIRHEGQLFTIVSVNHRTPGNKRGSMQTRMKNLKSGTMIDYRFRAEEFVDRAILDEVEFEYLYNEGDDFHFMNTETYEQMHLTRELL